MSILPHAIAGAVAGSFFENPVLAGLAGIGSHVVLDFIPHFDPEIKKNKKLKSVLKFVVWFVVIVEIIIVSLAFQYFRHYPSIIIGGLCGVLVDIDNFLQYKYPKSSLFPILSKIGIKTHDPDTSWHHKLKFHSVINFFLGALIEGVVVVLGLGFLLFKVAK